MRFVSDAKDFALFVWNWYVVRPWASLFPPQNDSKPEDQSPED